MIENGIIKIKTVGGVTYGITHDDLRQTLGVSGSNMGAILQVAQVNPWAKYKPTRCGGFHPNNWWQGPDGFCGFSIPQYDSAADLDGETDVWTYLKPRGNSVTPEEWYVRRDFDGYDHSAVLPFELKIPDYAFTTSATMVQILLGQNLASGNLALTDIGDFANCYFGVAVFKDNDSPYFKTASAKLSTGTDAATKINIEDIPHMGAAGTVRIYLFLGKTQASTKTTQYDHDLWFLNVDGMQGYKTIEVYPQVENVYLYQILGFLTPQDRKVLVPVETYVSNGVFHADFVMSDRFDFSRRYVLSSVTASAKLHSTGTVVQTQTIQTSSCAPSELEPGNNPGTSVNFSAPLPVWSPSLPTPSAGDYYEITITYNYS